VFFGSVCRAWGHWPGGVKIACSEAMVVLKSSVSAAPGQRQKKAGRWAQFILNLF